MELPHQYILHALPASLASSLRRETAVVADAVRLCQSENKIPDSLGTFQTQQVCGHSACAASLCRLEELQYFASLLIYSLSCWD